jgi:hypothetical protein
VSDAELDRLIASWAEHEAAELIARAKADALDVARERLEARMVDALMDAAARTAEPRRSGGVLLWVYGIVPAAFQAPPGEGVDGRPVGLHRHAGMSALVSEVPGERFDEAALRTRLEDVEDLEALARAHEAVLQQALRHGTVVPFRLCTIYSSPEGLEAMLDREGAALAATLDRLDGMQEWGVKAFLRAASPVPAASAASGTEYLKGKRERRDAADAGETVVAEIHARLTERAGAAALSRTQDRRLSGHEAEMVLNAAYLVPREGAEAFGGIVEELARRHEREGIELELTGPWPPHHFVEPPAP